MSNERKFTRLSDWNAVKALGLDPDRRPVSDKLYQPSGTPEPPMPTHLPISLSLHGDEQARDRQRRLAANRALEKSGVRARW